MKDSSRAAPLRRTGAACAEEPEAEGDRLRREEEPPGAEDQGVQARQLVQGEYQTGLPATTAEPAP